MSKHRIIVLGSGVSGLGCAKELVSRGYEVLIVEARSRVGGRLKGEPLELGKSYPSGSGSSRNNNDEEESSTSHTVDLGGALIHGIDNNPIHTISTQMGVPLHAISDYCLLLDENGWPFDPKEDEKISNLFNECLDITFQRITEQNTTTCTSDSTFGNLFDQVCREKGVSPDNPLLKWHQANLELPTGADFHELGYTWNDDEPYGFSGDHAAVETSWKFVMDRLADGLDIMYSSPVVKVQVVLPDGTTPLDISLSNNASDSSQDDEPFEQPASAAEENTPPPPPPPPPRAQRSQRSANKLEATPPTRSSGRLRGEDVNVRRSSRSNKGVIQMMQIGDMGSLSYDEPTKKHTRRKRPRAGLSDGDGDESFEVEPPSSTVQVTLQNGTVLEANSIVCTLPLGVLKLPPDQPGHIRFLPPLPQSKRTAIEQLGCGLLNKCAVSFPNVFWQDSDFLGLAGNLHSYLVLNAMKYTQKPILIFMYGGSFAKELESWTDSQVVEDCLVVLKKICGKAIPDPVDYCVTRWGQEQFSRMAFTYIPPGVNGPQQLSIAGEAIYDPAVPNRPLVMFAGEHTSPYHPSTMHGAFMSGIREAYRYDLFVDPSLDLEFENGDKIYEHTFVTRKVYKKGKKAADDQKPEDALSNSQKNQIRSRRRRFAGMALRKQPKQVLPSNGQTPQRKNGAESSKSSRRSQRSLSAKKVTGSADSSEEPPENATVDQ
jgi:monoamine oxidase